MGNGAKQRRKNNDVNKMRGPWLGLTAFFSLTAVGIALAILCLAGSNLPFIKGNYALCVVLSVLCLLFLCGVSVSFVLMDKGVVVKMLFSVYIFILFCLALILILQKTGFFKVAESAEGVQAYLEKTGVWMPILYILLQYLQVILLPIPSIVSTVAGLALFGAFKTMLFSFIGIFLGSITAFFIGRKLGYKAVAWMVGVDALEKWQQKLKGKDNLFLTVMFVLPLFPDDILCFVAGLSSMGNCYFLIMITVTRLLGIAATCYSFDFIPWNTWWGLLIWGIVIVGVVTAFIFLYKYMDKVQAFIKKLVKKRKKRTK